VDPLSQGALGAVAAAACATRRQVGPAALLGALAGMAPDLDVLIQSSRDPILFLEYHRQFSHALSFIPIGALVCSLALFPLLRARLTRRQVYLYCFLGYATHGLLDACTSYGTQLYWPFADTRVAWNNVSIVDPLFTLPLVGLAIAAARADRTVFARTAVGWAVVYLALGVVQRERAEAAGLELAEARGHSPGSIAAKPAFGSLLLWKTIYLEQGHFYVDAVRVGTVAQHFEGDSIARLSLERDLPWLGNSTQQARSLERFAWFSQDSLALDPRRSDYVIDVRYSMLPNRIDPLWGIQLSRAARRLDFPRYVTSRALSPADRSEFFGMLLGAARP